MGLDWKEAWAKGKKCREETHYFKKEALVYHDTTMTQLGTGPDLVASLSAIALIVVCPSRPLMSGSISRISSSKEDR